MAPADKGQKRKRSTLSLFSKKKSLSNLSKSSKKDSKPEEPAKPEMTFQPNKSERVSAAQLFGQSLAHDAIHTGYAAEREKLCNDEAATAWDHDARQKASEAEKEAGHIVTELREFERNVVFGNIASEAIPDPETTRDMGGQFLTNKDWIDKHSKIFEIAKMAPKGAILHLHFNAELEPERLLEEARGMPNMYIRSIQALLTQEDLDETEMVFQLLPKDTPSNNIFSKSYEGNAHNSKQEDMKSRIWMRWSEFRVKFNELPFQAKYAKNAENASNGDERKENSSQQGPVYLDPAETWILEKMVLSETEAYGPEQTVNGVWARFNQATRCFKGLINYTQVYTWYIDKAIDRLIEEKIMYAELRPMLLDKKIPTDDGQGYMDLSAQMRLIQKCVETKIGNLIDQNRRDQFPFGLKIIYCTPRSIPKTTMRNEILDCIRLKEEFPDLICGFDLVGAEDRKNPIGFYSEELKALEVVCKEKRLDIPFLFHAGETLLDTGGTGDPKNSNLYDAALLKAKRIGHGFSLLKHPHLVESFRKTSTSPGICIELCPISNELLHLCRNVKEHPYPELLAAGIPCTVNSDNPSLFRNSMSHEFYQIMVGAPSMSIHSWKQLALWSLEYSCLKKEEKEEAVKIFRRDWEAFCEQVVKDYGHIFGKDEDFKEKELRKVYCR